MFFSNFEFTIIKEKTNSPNTKPKTPPRIPVEIFQKVFLDIPNPTIKPRRIEQPRMTQFITVQLSSNFINNPNTKANVKITVASNPTRKNVIVMNF